MAIDVETAKEALNMISALAVLYLSLDIAAKLLLFAFSDKFVVTVTYSLDGTMRSKSFGVKAINEDYAVIKAFKKFILDEPANPTYGLRSIKSFQAAKLK